MKKLTLLFITILALAYTTTAQTFEWVKGAGGAGFDQGESIKVDKEGNVYTIGEFKDTVDFDPGAGLSDLISLGEWDIFIQKLDAEGKFLWAKAMGGVGSDRGLSIAIDDSGYVYSTGQFRETVDFDPGPDSANVTAVGGLDIFIQKLDSKGNLVWIKSMGGTDADRGNALTVDAQGNVYTTGFFVDTVDFDPNIGVRNLVADEGLNVFIQKLTTEGDFVWVKKMGQESVNMGRGITLDASGNIYTTGYFKATADFDPGAEVSTLVNKGQADIFIQKLDANGNFIWAKAVGGLDAESGISTAVDNLGNVYTTGYFKGTADFDPNAGIKNLTADSLNIFIQKLSPAGDLLWVKNIGGAGLDVGTSIVTDASGNTYTTGYFQGTVDFDFGPRVYNLTSAKYTDIFILKLNAAGILIWARSIGDTSFVIGRSVTVDASGGLYATGYFGYTVDFDPDAGVANLSAVGSGDIFVLKLDRGGNVAISNPKPSQIKLYPNPSTGLFTIELPAATRSADLQIIDLLGKTVHQSHLTQHKNELDLAQLSDGIYYISMTLRSGEKFYKKIILK